MMIMRTTPGIIKTTEKYIASLGRKREELTGEQWDFMINYIKTRRFAVPVLLIFGLFSIGMAFLYWHQGQKYFIQVIPNHSVKVSFDDQKEPLSLTPEEIRNYLEHMRDIYIMVGMKFVLSIFLIIFIIGSITLIRWQNRKTHKILLSRPLVIES
jgi:hypothetical protein